MRPYCAAIVSLLVSLPAARSCAIRPLQCGVLRAISSRISRRSVNSRACRVWYEEKVVAHFVPSRALAVWVVLTQVGPRLFRETLGAGQDAELHAAPLLVRMARAAHRAGCIAALRVAQRAAPLERPSGARVPAGSRSKPRERQLQHQLCRARASRLSSRSRAVALDACRARVASRSPTAERARRSLRLVALAARRDAAATVVRRHSERERRALLMGSSATTRRQESRRQLERVTDVDLVLGRLRGYRGRAVRAYYMGREYTNMGSTAPCTCCRSASPATSLPCSDRRAS